MISILFSISQWLRISLSLAYLGCVAFLSLLPPKDFPDIPLFPGADKIVHIIIYLGLASLICWSMYAEVKRGWYYFAILFSIGWGVMMEIFQFQMHLGRSFEFNDIIGNSIGTIIGVYIYTLMARQHKYIQSRKSDDFKIL
jgi:VanZ family protein